MIYHRIINPDTNEEGYMEVFNGELQRLTDLDGNTIHFDVYSLVSANEEPPWGLPDPELPPPPEEPALTVPEFLTKRQFLIQLLRAGMVAPEEVDTLATQPPTLMSAILAAMPEEEGLEARLSWAAMTQVERYNPLTIAVAAAAGTTEEQLDDFFRAAALI